MSRARKMPRRNVAVISAPRPIPRPGSGSVVLGAAGEEVVDDLVQELLESGVFRPRNRLDPAVDGGQQVVAAAKAGAQLDALRGWICGGAAFRLAGAEREELAATLRVERSEEHTSELQSLMRISYAVFCLKKKTR